MRTDPQSAAQALLESRKPLVDETPLHPRGPDAAEGGCGVLGFAANVPIAGRHVLRASQQMHNRGNGKGGGIAAVGLDPHEMRVAQEVLQSHYLIQIAYLDAGARGEVERSCLTSRFDIAQSYAIDPSTNWRNEKGLEMAPPEVVRYFCRVKPEQLAEFAENHALRHLPSRMVEDEFVYQNSFRLNQRYYASLGKKRAFVLCHGRDMLVFKIVGYAEQAARYYGLEDLKAHIWIAHQRYPTKGRVWHPGGAHPFIGVNEALVHNGDFANYHRVTEYLRQRNIVPLFLTDTEVSVLLFDLWDRVYGYPLEIVLEALAPTTERDFEMLPQAKRELYRAVQRVHLNGSPDGPWFFIVARSKPDLAQWQLLGITDTSMLRPQVFALYESEADCARSNASLKGQTKVQIGLIASERQAIQACLSGLAAEDPRFQKHADRYWVARGGSYSDGGAFAFTVSQSDKEINLVCHNKFGEDISVTPPRGKNKSPSSKIAIPSLTAPTPLQWFTSALPALMEIDLQGLTAWVEELVASSQKSDEQKEAAIQALTLMRDRRFPLGDKKRSAVLTAIEGGLMDLFRHLPLMGEKRASRFFRLDYSCRSNLAPPAPGQTTLVLDAQGFAPEGKDSAARWLAKAHSMGWKKFIAFDWRGGRFAGVGLGPNTEEVQIDIYNDSGDYLASGLDGARLIVHGDAQDQIGQILKSGQLVIHGDVGQTFLFGAKGGDVFVLGSAAGRPLINAVGHPRVVINGTCLDYLAESFMAGDPLSGGGFAIVNGLGFDEWQNLVELETPYPGGNLFSLASGGAIYLRDPRRVVDESQLNGGRFAELCKADWEVIEPYLRANQEYFGIPLERLLTFEGQSLPPERIYRKVEVDAEYLMH